MLLYLTELNNPELFKKFHFQAKEVPILDPLGATAGIFDGLVAMNRMEGGVHMFKKLLLSIVILSLEY